MGFLGLFIGPVLMALLVAIWREWVREVEISTGATVDVPPTPTAENDPLDDIVAREEDSNEATAFRKAAS
jgi:hypothetical protein